MTIYLSSRGVPLLCQEVDKYNRPIVTMEDYMKWYGVIILYPCGRVEDVNPGVIDEINNKLGCSLFVDHNCHPRLLNEIAEKIGGVADSKAIEMTGGRWVNEIMDGKLPGFPNFDIPA